MCRILLGSLCLVDLKKNILKTFSIADDEQLARFKQKFYHISDFFVLMDAIRGKNSFQFVFECKSGCEPGKIIKSNSRSPTSNLKAHISTTHPENLNSFLMLRECNKTSSGQSTVFIQKIWINYLVVFYN